jgi:hypothetical protein
MLANNEILYLNTSEFAAVTAFSRLLMRADTVRHFSVICVLAERGEAVDDHEQQAKSPGLTAFLIRESLLSSHRPQD